MGCRQQRPKVQGAELTRHPCCLRTQQISGPPVPGEDLCGLVAGHGYRLGRGDAVKPALSRVPAPERVSTELRGIESRTNPQRLNQVVDAVRPKALPEVPPSAHRPKQRPLDQAGDLLPRFERGSRPAEHRVFVPLAGLICLGKPDPQHIGGSFGAVRILDAAASGGKSH